MKLAAIPDQIDSRSVLLPRLQRGHAWNRDQVYGLMRFGCIADTQSAAC
jgi:hypothetical protein